MPVEQRRRLIALLCFALLCPSLLRLCFQFSTCNQICTYEEPSRHHTQRSRPNECAPSCLSPDGDLAIAIMETCGDPTTQIECLDDTPGCQLINQPSEELAFTTKPTPLIAGKTYSVYLGTYGTQGVGGPGNTPPVPLSVHAQTNKNTSKPQHIRSLDSKG